MSTDWWPELLSHIPKERPWDDSSVVVAEINSYPGTPNPGHRRTFSALVPMEQLEQVKANLGKLGTDVDTSGPFPTPRHGNRYEPKFWIDAHDLPSQKYEPLVLSWKSHDKTILMPDHGFLMTYGLCSRNLKEDLVTWDDQSAPVHDVVKVCSPSTWDFPTSTHGYVTINRDYLQDYLTLRGMALVQVFWEERWGPMDSETQKKIGQEEAIEIRFPDKLFQLNRFLHDKNVAVAQVWGGRVVATAGELPISDDTLEIKGLVWPGFPKPVTHEMAMKSEPLRYVYVNDAILADFEGRPNYKVHPETGSVTFGTQWSVSYCDRVGRNMIRLEIKKLYEGVPPAITRRWNKFAVPQPPDSAYPDILSERHIGVRAKELTYSMVELGHALASLSYSVGLSELQTEDFVSLQKSVLDYYGWWNFPDTEAIARHLPLDSTADALLDRSIKLNKLVVEGISEASLRKLLIKLGVPEESIKKYRTLKLLDALACMAQLGAKAGLSLSKDGPMIWERLSKEGTNPAQPISHLFALYDIRILGGHKATEVQKELQTELQRFGVNPSEVASGYGRAIDRIYDTLTTELGQTAEKIKQAM